MRKLTFLTLLAGAALRQIAAASTPDLSFRVTPERDLVYSNGSREVILQVDLEGRRPEAGRRAPMNLAVVFDRSGSMQGAKIEKARQAACTAIDHLGDSDYFSFIIFDNEAEVLISPARVGGPGNRDELKSMINRVQPRGSTAIHAGVTLGAKQVRKFIEKEYVNRVILLSDGIANVGPSRTTDLAELGREIRRDGMSVTTIGLGDDYNEDLMTALAEASNANYYYVRDAEKLPGIFAEELGLARTMIARGVRIRITVPRGVRLQEIIGRPDIEVRSETAEIILPEYFGAEKRRFLAKCIVEKPTNETLEVASVNLNYESGEGKKVEPPKQSVSVKFTENAKDSDDSLKSDVAQELTRTNNRLAKEKAVKFADEGRINDAQNVLRAQSKSNAALPAGAKPADLSAENKKLEADAAELGSSGAFAPATRKRMQYENWQDKYQKR